MRKPKRYDAVIAFDLDDTLYLERDYVESGLRAVGTWAKRQLGVAGLGQDMVSRFSRGARGDIFDQSLADAGISASPDLIGRMLRVYRQHRPLIRLAEDTVRFLERRPADIGLAIITDGFLDAQRRKIRALGLHRWGIDLAICTDRWGRSSWKPSPRAFEHVQSFFEMVPSLCVYVADNPSKDFIAPNRLGWSTVQIERPLRIHQGPALQGEQANQLIDSLDCIVP